MPRIKMTVNTYHILAIIILSNLSGQFCYPQLRFLQIITRHGDRSATVPYPMDPYQETIWPQGKGQLTQQGMQQMYRLGQLIRKRYAGFISEKYYLKEWYSRSTDKDRTLMSAQTLLAGVFPPKEDQIWNEDIPWQPAAVHTVPEQDDKFLELSIGGVPCPRYMQLLITTRETLAYKRENATFKDVYEYILPHSGIAPPLTPILTWNVWDTLNTQRLNNISLPQWVTEDIMTVIPQKLIPFEYRTRFFPSEKARLLGGVQLWKLCKNMMDWIDGTTDRFHKVNYYSSHDDNILLLLVAFGAYYNRMVPYASAMFIELHEMKPNDFSVSVSLINETDSQQVHNITLPGCKFYCPIEQFLNLTKEYSLHPDHHNDACQAKYIPTRNDFIAIILATSGFCIILLVIIIIYCKSSAKRKEVNGYYAL